jgi:hypothetical protein
MNRTLLNPCNYSFAQLIKMAHPDFSSGQLDEIKYQLYALSQHERNDVVKYLCNRASWYYDDVKGSDGVIYTSFSPHTTK